MALDGYSTLDRLDLRILAILQADGRITNQALAQQVALSASACLARVRRLEADGLIQGYHARLDIERIRPTVTVYGEVTLKSHRPADLLAFEAVLAEIPEVVEAAQVSGSFDYLIKVVAPDVRAWGDLADRLLQEGLGVDKIASHILMKDAKPYRGTPVTPVPSRP
ncbi:Lrp/AsnC family transcriptional regulator [Phenylobacterium sp.]|uniref:Lrp/AsnC family transcriptional regulator n=1 Tax=Phenylobacterium sp. TaxID=1871053 RepID=UPI00286C5AB9|nr:Lrp/AsnC family transcriptional regulator [Phenylobacterium sp.]